MTYPMSLSKRALLPRQEVAVTVRYWRAHEDAKNSRLFLVGARGGGSGMIHPADAIVRAGCVGRGLAKGGGVLLGRTTAYYLVEGLKVSIALLRRGKNDCAGRVLEVKPTLGAILGHVVARATHTNVRLRC